MVFPPRPSPIERPALSVALAIAIPFAALGVQWLLWDYFKPYVWFLFFPAAFFSAWIGGLGGGLAATVISAVLVWYFFIPPALSFALKDQSAGYSIAVFVFMGSLFAWFHNHLRHAMRRTDEALSTAQAANEKITQLYEKTLELDALKSQFFANVSHELRTPLTLILGPLEQRLHRPLSASFSAAEQRETETMLRNARLLYRHVTDLLDAAKLEAGQMRLDYAPLDLAALVRTMASHFESLAAERHIDYRVNTPDPLAGEADQEKLQRVLLNLLSNAFKFTPDGGSITLHLAQEDGQARIDVQDNGPGVPAAQRALVFERFRQVEGDARRRYGGTGLGLAIVKDFVELHGGTISLGEAAGGGALFSVRLPLRAPAGTVFGTPLALDEVIDRQAVEELEAPAPVVLPRQGHLPLGDAPLVLVVEDNIDMNAFIASALRPRYLVCTAFNGHEGMNKAVDLQPDLILSDLMMPVMSGDAMVSELRSQPATRDIPIVMLTAKTDDATRLRLLQDGVQEYLSKPFSTEELLVRVDSLVAARRRTSEALGRSEQRFRATFEQAAVGIALVALVAPDGRWLQVNQKLCDIVGYTHDELLGKSFQDITHPEDLDSDLAHVQQILAGVIEHYALEKRYLRQDGSVIWINLSVALVRHADRSPAYFISVVEDIQRRKAAETALQAREATLKEAQRLAGLGNWTWDLHSDRHVWSEEIYRIYGRDPRLPPAIYPEVQAYFTPDSWARLAATVETCLAHGTPYECEAEVVRADGTHRWITARGEASRDRDGHIVGLYGTVQDITERIQAAEALRELNLSLEQRVEQRTAELIAANRELDAFAYAVSHDLRAPLRAMTGFAQALTEDYGGKLDNEAKTYLDQIGIASRKMTELIEGILALSRCTRGALQRTTIDLSALATEVLADLARADPDRPMTLHIEPGLSVSGDAGMIEVVMRNLLGNAWKYTARSTAPTIRVYAGMIDGVHGLCIADNGAGFDMAYAERLFQPFQRLHRQDEFPGIGIGLATVQRIVRRHGGEIRATATPGQGATFCFTLADASEARR